MSYDTPDWWAGLERRDDEEPAPMRLPFMRLKRFIVIGLEDLCEALRHHPYPCRLASLSEDLDRRWDAGVWKTVDICCDCEHPSPGPSRVGDCSRCHRLIVP